MWKLNVLLVVLCVHHCKSGEYDLLSFVLVFGETPKENQKFFLNETQKLMQHSAFEKNLETVLYCFGYTESFNSESTQRIVKSYIYRNEFNILVLDWSNYSGNRYFDAASKIPDVADLVSKALIEMEYNGFYFQGLHGVGHSLGGQLIGHIGRSIFSNSNQMLKMERITALDPAGPLFNPLNEIFVALDQNDGKFVDVIHTDAGKFGASEKCGDADFWPNGGQDQPDCPIPSINFSDENNFCNHRRSWMYWEESIYDKTDKPIFHSIRCNSWYEFKKGWCNRHTSNIGFMGLNADLSLSGNYFLQLNTISPFSRDYVGTYFRPRH